MGYRKKKKPQQREKVLFGKDYVCFFALVKETIREYGSYKFVIVDKEGKEVPIKIEQNGTTWINGKEHTDADAREFIARNAGDFERLFLELTKKHDPELNIMPRLYLAKLTDMSGTYRKPANVEFYDGEKMRKFKIERAGLDGKFYLDEMELIKSEAIKYVERYYSGFLIGMKAAIKTMKNARTSVYENNKIPSSYSQIAKTQVQHSEIVNGKLQVNLDSFLPQKKPRKTGKDEMKAGENIIIAKKRGYVE